MMLDSGCSWDQEKIVTFGDFQYTVYWDADRDDNLHFFYATRKGFRCLESRAAENWSKWSGYPLTGPALTGGDASKHDRRRWIEKGILSFTAKLKANGFAIVDLVRANGS